MAKLKGPVMLTILDGFGIGDGQDPTNAVVQANPRTFLELWDKCPHTLLDASGMAVGLPDGQMGNSEVGHLNIGAGRIVYQELTRITKEAQEGTLFTRPTLVKAYEKGAKQALHLVGLLSDGGVHSHIDHLKAILRGAKEAGVGKVYIHAFLDGRDVPPQSALAYIDDIAHYCNELGLGSIETIGGRYYGMDRDQRWERVQLAYNAIVCGSGTEVGCAHEAVEHSYADETTDEFVIPSVVEGYTGMQDGDAILFFNFRPDRARQLVRAVVDPDFTGFERKHVLQGSYVASMTRYEADLPVPVVYDKELLTDTLGEVLAKGGYRQLRIAETEKYAHVTYFFNGGKEDIFPGEDRILVPSPKVATYDLQPEMSAPEVTEKVVSAIRSGEYDMIILNYANPDMVGHTGDFEAAKRAILAVDAGLSEIVKAIQDRNGQLLITADHGNSEVMVDHTTEIPHTAHTTNPVPLILVGAPEGVTLRPGRLCDLAPTMLALGGIEQPEAMSGESLLVQ